MILVQKTKIEKAKVFFLYFFFNFRSNHRFFFVLLKLSLVFNSKFFVLIKAQKMINDVFKFLFFQFFFLLLYFSFNFFDIDIGYDEERRPTYSVGNMTDKKSWQNSRIYFLEIIPWICHNRSYFLFVFFLCVNLLV
jgi:hypothetical protein